MRFLRILLFLVLPAAFASPALAAGPGEVSFTIMSYNIHSGRDIKGRYALDEAIRIMAAEKPDIVILQETSCSWTGRIARALGHLHGVSIKAYHNKTPCLAITSRWPVKARRLPLPASPEKRGFLKAVVDINGVAVSLYGLHFSRKGLMEGRVRGLLNEVFGKSARYRQAEDVLKAARRDKAPYKVLAGDLNTFPQSHAYDLLAASFSDVFRGRAQPGSFRLREAKGGRFANMPNPRIDHIFVSRNLEFKDARVIQKGPSDHYPVAAVITLPLKRTVAKKSKGK